MELTSEGMQTDTFLEIYEYLAEQMYSIYGSDINIDQDSPDGQFLGIMTKLVYDAQQSSLFLYNNINPELATGTMQDVILKVTGLVRGAATRSSVDITITTDTAVSLSSGYIIKDDLSQEWETTDDYELVTGDNIVSFVASDWGAVEAAAGTITEAVTIILGITSLTNASAATVGVEEETESEVRVRRSKSLANPAYSTLGAIQAKLNTITTVTDTAVYENETSVYDSEKDIDPNTLWVIVDGGEISDITENLCIQKTSGCGTKGDITSTWQETYTRNDGTTRVHTHTVNFDRPVEVPLYVKVDARLRVSGQSLDLVAIQNMLSTPTFYIADYLQAAELYEYGFEAGSNFILTNMQISDDNITFTSDELFSGYAGKFVIDAANVTVTEVS